MIVHMVSALRRSLGRFFACLTLLLPFETMASDADVRKLGGEQVRSSEPDDCGKECAKAPAPPPGWQQVLDQYGLLLPKIPQMPSACRAPRQYRSISLDKMPRQPCFFA